MNLVGGQAKFETNTNVQNRNQKSFRFLNLDFEFVSDFDIMISNSK